MLRHKFGWTDVEVPVIGQGTLMIEGGRGTMSIAVGALRLGLDLGMTHIDTAEMYGEGHTEELLSEAIAGRRNQVFLVSKVLPSNASYEGTLKACEHSLRQTGLTCTCYIGLVAILLVRLCVPWRSWWQKG